MLCVSSLLTNARFRAKSNSRLDGTTHPLVSDKLLNRFSVIYVYVFYISFILSLVTPEFGFSERYYLRAIVYNG